MTPRCVVQRLVLTLACAALALGALPPPAQAATALGSVWILNGAPSLVTDAQIAFDQGALDAWAAAVLAPHWRLLPRAVIVIYTPRVAHGYAGLHFARGALPVAYVRIDPGVAAASWLLAASHELAEATADLTGNTLIPERVGGAPIQILQEIADPVASIPLPFRYGGQTLLLSDFVLPAWYDPQAPGPYDAAGYLTRPLAPSPYDAYQYWNGSALLTQHG